MYNDSYDDLIAAVASWINRSDLNANVPDFVALAEDEIFKVYSARENEVTLTVDRTTEDPVTGTLPVPPDYRTMITFTADGVPLRRSQLSQVQAWQAAQEGTFINPPKSFARDFTDFVLYPFPDSGKVYELYYYGNLTRLSSSNQTNAILAKNGGLYLYGSLVEAEPFLRGAQLQLVQLWRDRYNKIMADVSLERSEEDVSGSVNVVSRGF